MYSIGKPVFILSLVERHHVLIVINVVLFIN
jgi:hypothetical protein